MSAAMGTNTEKSTVIRGAKRASYDEESIYKILDASFLCHVGFTVNDEARIIPTAYVRIENSIYIHGNIKNQMMTVLLSGQTACVEVTIVDGMVLGRSAFHHSVNYRSVVFFAKAEAVKGQDKPKILDALIEHYVPGRSTYIRDHLEKELEATLVLKLEIDEASAKIRGGPPADNEKDYELDTWAGVLEIKSVIENVHPCPRLKKDVQVPDHVIQFCEKFKFTV
ncbi:pyridoxamine 5'-phosphate oxidase family protein [Aurantivibrio infirmus]